MRTRIFVIAVAFLLVAGAVAAQKAQFVQLSGVGYMTGGPSVGTVDCLGGAPTGTWPPCTAGRSLLRGVTVPYY